ncbi:hypothetical protein LWI28_006978 [Acer negundo]|uniref:Reverse transcriptase domain-containing protein n=1 Tax=Acer negundo TaxID=4023 RepID=A0AAD5IG07_ACENE|nr:hypothetical protein LWI28_006978 [Acer negundo]
MRVHLMATFSAEEIKNAVFQLGPTKAPGPDGFHALFFQKFWVMVEQDITRICLQVLNGVTSIKEFNNTNIVLIPKKKQPETLKDFRPISLCNVVYKIITKVLANRLKSILPELISPNQSAFVPGRLIFDNVMASFEILHSINRRKIGHKGLMALKVDMSKAYDRIEWGFLRAILEKMEFPQKWVDLVLDCVATVGFSFVLNGKVMGSIVPSRGLRQGCPLSPYLFILCAEALSCLIRKSERDGRTLGVRCCRGSPLISHLFFTDDSIVFSKASIESGIQIKEILRLYEKASGQQVNLQKSSITFSPNVTNELRMDIQNSLGISDHYSHDCYLGLLTLVGRNRTKTFQDIKDKVWRRVRSWKRKLFSLGGKEVLIKAVAQAIPNYIMSIFQIPFGLCKELNSIIFKFWWGTKDGKRKISWIKWETMCFPKSHGGLGFKDLYAFNQALLAKQAWCLLISPSSLAGRILKAKYYKNGNFLQASFKPGGSYIWRSILWGREILHKGLRWQVGNGEHIKV